MTTELADFSIYTIVHADELRRIYEAGGAAERSEKKPWVSGARLFNEATGDGRRMPILFGDAAYIEGVIYYAFLTGVRVMGEGNEGPTQYAFEGLTPVNPPVPKRALTLRSNGRPLSDDYIRPYAIVQTPAFARWPEAATDKPGRVARLLDALLPGRAPAPHPTPIYLFGYSGHTDEEITAALGADGLLIDIRFSPRSRRVGFSRAGLQRAYGERYYHVRELGNADRQAGGIQLADPTAGLQTIDELAAGHAGPLFLMCACADAAGCHRAVVGRLLRERGYRVAEVDFGRITH